VGKSVHEWGRGLRGKARDFNVMEVRIRRAKKLNGQWLKKRGEEGERGGGGGGGTLGQSHDSSCFGAGPPLRNGGGGGEEWWWVENAVL
jgi:hypothetical protein